MVDERDKQLENPYRVKLVDAITQRRRVVFHVTPELVETRTVNYKTIDPVHAPGQIAAYANTMSRIFSIGDIKLVSRTQEEASKNLKALWTLRSWTVPRFGVSTLNDENRFCREVLESNPSIPGSNSEVRRNDQNVLECEAGRELRGEPVKVLLLSAYSRDGLRNTAQHIYKVPVVIQNLTIPYPTDVDYINTYFDVPMPLIMTIDISLMETHSVREYENFDLDRFRKGLLRSF